MDAAKSAGVTFVRVYTLTTTAGGNGSIDPAPGRHAYDSGTSVTLTATPDAGYQVAAWEGACSAVVAPATTCALTMDADQTAGVTFVAGLHPHGDGHGRRQRHPVRDDDAPRRRRGAADGPLETTPPTTSRAGAGPAAARPRPATSRWTPPRR